jgi:hypothetical protein
MWSDGETGAPLHINMSNDIRVMDSGTLTRYAASPSGALI